MSSEGSIFDDDYDDYCSDGLDSDDLFEFDFDSDELSEKSVDTEGEMQHDEKNLQQETALRNALHQWALKFHVTLVALTALLLLLKPFLLFSLPSDARTLMGTVRNVKIVKLAGGEYHYFGLERAAVAILRDYSRERKEVKELKLTFNIDGLPISHSGTEGFWLISCSEQNSKKVYLVAAFYGPKKPSDANEFIEEFVRELTALCNNGLREKQVLISCSALICDAPAKSFILYLKGHTGYNSCSKCLIKGEYISRKSKRNGKERNGTVCFPGIGPFRMKTDEGFSQNVYEEYDTGKETLLKIIPNFGCISCVPLDYMHLILLGVVKKLIRLWIMGPLSVRLGATDVTKISKILLILKKSTPMEFNRKPRSLAEFTHWKATEFRTFLLYTGPVALKNILKPEMYDNFVLLHTAVSMLVSECYVQTSENIDKCQKMFEDFVLGFQRIYGKQYVSHNVHNLLHICSDVKKNGALDKFSAFKFENEMSSIKRMVRKGHKPLEQIARRYSEREKFEQPLMEKSYSLIAEHNNGPLSRDCLNIKKQYKRLKYKDLTIDCTTPKDNSILLKDGTFCAVKNIVVSHINDILFIVKPFLKTNYSLYSNPDSRNIDIYIAANSRKSEFATPISNLRSKVWRIPSNEGIIFLPLRHTPSTN